MKYTYIDGINAISRVEHNFDIPVKDWIPRCAVWIVEALEEINPSVTLEETSKVVTVTDYQFDLPCDIKLLKSIMLNGHRLDRYDFINGLESDNIPDLKVLRLNRRPGYQLFNKGKGICYLETGELTIYYKRLPIKLQTELNVLIPLIPDDETCTIAISWYILYAILRRGYIHPTYTLNSNNPILNPFIQWDIFKKKARNSVAIDNDEYSIISSMIRTMILDYNFKDNTDSLSYYTHKL